MATRCWRRSTGHGSRKPMVSRSDLEVEYFDEELFNGATVYDVMTRSPRVIITATDLVRAKPFAFTREQLNGICVDPRQRARGARGVRIRRDADLFRAAGHAQLRRRLRIPAAGKRSASTDGGEEDVYRRERAERLLSFLDSTNYPYLHLADGAFADNLGARAILDEVALGESVTDALRRNGFARARRMLFIVVDARTGFDRRYAQRPEPLGIKKVMDAVVSATFNRYSFETMNLHARTREALGDRGAHHALRRRRWRSRTATSSTSTSWNCQFERVKDAARARLPGPHSHCVHALDRADHPAAPRRPSARGRVAGTARISSRNPPGVGAAAAGRAAPTAPSVIFPMFCRNACATLAPCSRSGESWWPSRIPRRAPCPRSTRLRRSPRA